ncbi:hypothetical protein B0H17DRAFT_1136437 [Mycena rosella]|uniref:Secreted protein n=1 Tax=Mycena rosella TaxID=1033263 RepID=A0AAD7DAT4_MYCRO|nr:hypothetical protein B0H17DRAFT_1136437 [Mycena rosella]
MLPKTVTLPLVFVTAVGSCLPQVPHQHTPLPRDNGIPAPKTAHRRGMFNGPSSTHEPHRRNVECMSFCETLCRNVEKNHHISRGVGDFSLKNRKPGEAQAAEKIEGILLDDTCVEEEEGDDDVDDDNASVATDASSDSDSDDEDELDRTEAVRATQNVAALGEQAVSHIIFELEEMASRLTDLGEYLDQRVTGLAPEERARVGKGYGQLAGLMAKLQRVMDLPPPSTQQPTSPTIPVQNIVSPTTAFVPPSPNPRKRKNILPPSPEKAQKRHQSHNIH